MHRHLPRLQIELPHGKSIRSYVLPRQRPAILHPTDACFESHIPPLTKWKPFYCGLGTDFLSSEIHSLSFDPSPTFPVQELPGCRSSSKVQQLLPRSFRLIDKAAHQFHIEACWSWQNCFPWRCPCDQSASLHIQLPSMND